MAQAGLTVSGTSQADAKAGHSDPTVSFRRSWSSTDKSYSGDNRLVSPKSSYRRRCSAPRCRLNLSWGWRRSQGYGCSPFKKLRELGSNRSEIKRLIPGQFESHETCKNIKEEYNCYFNERGLYENLFSWRPSDVEIWIYAINSYLQQRWSVCQMAAL